MKNIVYLYKRILSMNVKGFFESIEKVYQKTGKGKVLIFFDIVWCGIRHLAGYVDYHLFAMYQLNEAQRKQVMTRGRNNAYVRALNNAQYNYIFNSKKDFNETFSDFINREWFALSDGRFTDFADFIRNKDIIFAKPNNGICGKNIEKLRVSDFEDIRTLWYYLESKQLMLVEEAIVQHPHMQMLHPHSINTIRFVTVLYNNEAHIAATYLRIGNNNIVDNFNSGGMVVPVNTLNGMVEHVAINKNGEHFEKHPLTQVSIVGFSIPMWNACIELVKKASFIVPEVGFVGWDVAVAANCPCLVEANEYPGHDIYQLPAHTDDKVGMYPKFQKILRIK